MNPQQAWQELLEELSVFEDPLDRLVYLMDQAKALPCLPPSLQKDIFKVEGCQSSLWLVPAFQGDSCYFKVDSDAVITKAIAHALLGCYEGRQPQEIVRYGLDLENAELLTQLSPNRRNGLSNLNARVLNFAHSVLGNPANGT